MPACCYLEPTLLACPAPDPVIDVLNFQQMANLAVPAILNEGISNLAPLVISNQSISKKLRTICRGVASEYTNLADHPRVKASHKLFKNSITKWTRCYCTVCK